MKSDFFPGIEFEHTLDGILFEKYDQFLSEKYCVDGDYLIENLDELIKLRDVVIPHNLVRGSRILEEVGNRTAEDFAGQRKLNLKKVYGIYWWDDLFCKEVPRTIEEMCEDDIRLALDIVKKYPEHKGLIISEEAQL